MSRLAKKEGIHNRILPGYEHLNRFYCKETQKEMVKIKPGEYYVTRSDEVIATVLGSCISVCIRDPYAGIGGMNHFMLPENNNKEQDSWEYNKANRAARYGTDAMEHLINDILKHGGIKSNFEIKVCGGGKIFERMSDVGIKNIRFIKNYLDTEGFKPVSVDVGSIYPRKVRYFPADGRMQIKKLNSMHNNTIVQRENEYQSKLTVEETAGDVELF